MINEPSLNTISNFHFQIIHLKEKPSRKIESFAITYLRNKYPKVKITKNAPILDRGIPDLLVRHNDKEYYVEIKSLDDGLRVNQINWMFNNQDKNVLVLFFTWERKYLRELRSRCLELVSLEEVKERRKKQREFKRYEAIMKKKGQKPFLY